MSSLPKTMKAFRIHKENRTLSMDEVEVPQPGPGEVLVKIDAAGLCHSDVGILKRGLAIAPDFPDVWTMGHEGCGTIVSFGPTVDPPALHIHTSNPPGLKVGGRYAIYAIKGCMKSDCPSCSSKRENICPLKTLLGVGVDGSWAEYAAVPARQLIPVPENVSSAAACIATDAIVTPYHAILNRGKVDSESTVLIIGLGGLGTNAVQIAKHIAKVKRVYASDLKEDARELALTLGADEVFDAQTLVQQVQERQLQISHVFDFVGTKPSLLSALSTAAFGAKVVLVGLTAPTVEFPPLLAAAKEINLHGSFWGTQREIAEVLNLISEGRIKPEVIEKPLVEAETWLEKMIQGQLKGRVAFIPQ